MSVKRRDLVRYLEENGFYRLRVGCVGQRDHRRICPAVPIRAPLRAECERSTYASHQSKPTYHVLERFTAFALCDGPFLAQEPTP